MSDGPAVLKDFAIYLKETIARNNYHGQNIHRDRCDYITERALRAFWDQEKIRDAICWTQDAKLLPPRTILDSYVTVFSIVASISRPWLISAFLEADLNDQRLPLAGLPTAWSDDADKRELYQEFEKAQWKFCPLVFNTRRHHKAELDAFRIWPILSKEPLQEDVNEKFDEVVLYKVELHPDCLGMDQQMSSTVVFKEYIKNDPETTTLFENEVELYGQLRGHNSDSHIVKEYGSFVQVGRRIVILEYADGGNLLDFFSQHGPIADSHNRLIFWRAFLELLKGLHAIHNLSLNEKRSIKTNPQWVLKGSHQDIRPQNILVFQNQSDVYNPVFKWADFGTSHVRRTRFEGRDHEGINQRGNGMYSAPEASRDPKQAKGRLEKGILKKTDIWSFGGVISEALVWCLFGNDERLKYQDAREEATEKARFDRGYHAGCFHDGECRLKVVDHVHKRVEAQTQDPIIRLVSRLTLGKMLQADHDERWDAKNLHWYFTRWHFEEDQEELRSSQLPSSIPPQDGPLNNGQQQPRLLDAPANAATGYYRASSMSRNSGHLSSYRSSRRVVSEGTIRSQFDPQSALGGEEGHPHTRDSDSHLPLEPDTYNLSGPSRPPLHQHWRTDPLATRYQADSPVVNVMELPAGIRWSLDTQDRPIQTSRSGRRGDERGESSNGNHNTATQRLDDLIPSQLPPSSSPYVHSPGNTLTISQLYIRITINSSFLRRALGFGRLFQDLCKEYPGLDGVLEKVKGIDGRDQVFILDNSASMAVHRDQMAQTVRVLSWLAKKGRVDRQIEVYYTCPLQKPYSSADPVKLENSVRNQKFSAQCSMAASIDQIAEKVLRWAFRPVSVYVLTNGRWNDYGSTQGLLDVDDAIGRVLGKIEAMGKPCRFVGFQFIRFFEDGCSLDVVGKQRLDFLDNSLPSSNSMRDIVDTRDYDSDICAMLTGGIFREDDEA